MRPCTCGSPATHGVPAWDRAGLSGGLCDDCAVRFEAAAEWRFRMNTPYRLTPDPGQPSLFTEEAP